MSDTLQQKIDNAFRNRISEHWTAHQIDKALQEFREQIEAIPENHDNSWLWKKKILALLGEKHE